MGQQVADGDVSFAIRSEVRQIFCDWIVGAELSFLIQLHHRGRRCQALRQRRHVEDGVDGHRSWVGSSERMPKALR